MDKILKVQTQIGKLAKDKKNPFFKSSYFDVNQIIEQLLPLLEEHELTVIQPLSNIDGKLAIRTVVSDGDKIIIDEKVPLPETTDSQKNGSAITYYRRYFLQSLFLLQAEDDDGNKAVERVKLNEQYENWDKIKESVKAGTYTVEKLREKFYITKDMEDKLKS